MEKKIYQFWFYFILTVLAIFLVPICIFFLIKFFSEDSGRWNLVFATWSGAFAIIAVRLMIPVKYFLTIDFGKKSIRHVGCPVVPIYSHRKERKKVEESVKFGEFSNEMFLLETTSVEVYKLNKIEWKNLRGVYVFNKFLKLNSIDGKQNYIPIAMYSKKQIRRLLAYIQEINPNIQHINV